jgi:hypothetical protein
VAEEEDPNSVSYYVCPTRDRKLLSDVLVKNCPRYGSLEELAKAISVMPGRSDATVASPDEWDAGHRVLRPLTKGEVAQLKHLLEKQ